MMKKLSLTVLVVAIFTLYSLGIRHKLPIIGRPSSLSSGNSAPNNASNSSISNNNNSSSTPSQSYNDGTYIGSPADAFYGNVQVSVTISSGKITAVNFLQYPNTHSTSVMINQQAMPFLQQEAIQAQNANVQIITGATLTSQAFIQSLMSALSKA